MDSSTNSETDDDKPLSNNLTRKRKSFGRIQDAAKKIRNHSYETGDPCECKRFKCFQIITEEQRRTVINKLNSMSDRNEQNSHLCGLISIQDVKRRRPRHEENEANLRDNSFTFKIRLLDENGAFKEIEVCQKAFISLHGITNRRLITLKRYLKESGSSCHDRRGTHQNRPHKINDHTVRQIHDHIKSFKGRNSHYSLKSSRRQYLPETLNVKECMHFTLNKSTPLLVMKLTEIFSSKISTLDSDIPDLTPAVLVMQRK